MSDLFTPEYFEKHITTVVPIVNVDLLIKDKEGRILLSWRDDGMFYGWHIPGRIIRFKESLKDAARECWKVEIGNIPPDFEFIEYFESIHDHDVRGHFITFVFETNNANYLDIDYDIAGRVEWFDKCPEDLIPEQRRYKKYFK